MTGLDQLASWSLGIAMGILYKAIKYYREHCFILSSRIQFSQSIVQKDGQQWRLYQLASLDNDIR